MIASIRGILLEKHPTRLVVETGGVGLDIQVPIPTSQAMPEPGQEVSIFTVLVVREDALTLYGFASKESRTLFLKLTSVSGIGPKLALGALSGPSAEELVGALRSEDIGLLTRLPGIGKKTAARMVVDLKDGLKEFGDGETDTSTASPAQADAIQALVSLGYQKAAALKAVLRAAQKEPEASVEDLIRSALSAVTGG